jgi:flagellar assembly protein FliH
MSSKVLGAREADQHEAPLWRQAGVPPPAAHSRHGDDSDGEREREAAQLRAQVSEMQAGLPAALDKAKLEGRRSAEAEAQRAETQLRDEFTGRQASTLTELIAVRHQMRRQMEEDLVALAVVVARRIVRRELSVDPEALLGIARAAIGQIEAREIHQVRVSSREAELMKKLLADPTLPSKVNVVADAGLEAGSLVFETARGTIDASVEVQLSEIDRGLADVLRRSV